MDFSPSEYVIPSSLSEALALLRERGEKTTILAGGVTFYELAKRGLFSDTEVVMDISRLGLDDIQCLESEDIVIGSMVTFARLLKYTEEGKNTNQFPSALIDMLSNFVPHQVRTMATVGGSICSAVPFLDMPTVLMALNAKLRIRSEDESRETDIENFYVGLFGTTLNKDELLTEVIIPSQGERSGSAFQNFKRTALDIPILNSAASVSLNPSGEVKQACVALGGIEQKIIRVSEVENILIGKKWISESILDATSPISKITPLPSVHADAAYKTKIARVMVSETILRAIERAGQRR